MSRNSVSRDFAFLETLARASGHIETHVFLRPPASRRIQYVMLCVL